MTAKSCVRPSTHTSIFRMTNVFRSDGEQGRPWKFVRQLSMRSSRSSSRSPRTNFLDMQSEIRGIAKGRKSHVDTQTPTWNLRLYILEICHVCLDKIVSFRVCLIFFHSASGRSGSLRSPSAPAGKVAIGGASFPSSLAPSLGRDTRAQRGGVSRPSHAPSTLRARWSRTSGG